MSRIAKPWYYRQTGWWMAWIDGRKEKLAKGKANRKAAETKLLELRLQAAKNPVPDSPDQTVASVIETYQEFARKRLASNTMAVRAPYLQSFAEAHGWRLVADCKPLHMEQWLDEHPEWVSDWTKNGALRNVHVAFNWARKRRLIPENPFRGVSHPVGAPRRDITLAEFKAILRGTRSRGRKRPTPGHWIRQVLIFLWFTGCRPSEAARLTWKDINFEQQMIILTKHKTARMQRPPKPRVIPLDPRVVRLLQSLARKSDYVFLNHRGTPWNKDSLSLRVNRARQVLGVSDEATLYGTRHAFGTRAVLQGADIKTVSELMGHTTTRTAEHYVHLAGKHPHLAAAMLQVNAPRRGA
jgi:integrase